MIERLPLFYETFLKLLFEQYKESPKVLGMLEAFAAEFDLIDQALVEVANEVLNIDAAVGAQLDMLGRVANIPRLGRSDPLYRDDLLIAFQTKNSGTPEQIIKAVKSLTNSTYTHFYPEFPAGFWVVYDGEGLTQDILNKIAPAGVQAMAGCILVDASLDPIVLADGDFILLIGPCGPTPLYSEDDLLLTTELADPIYSEI